MAILWYHWLAITFLLFMYIIFYGIRHGLVIYNKYIRAFPDYEGYWFNDDGSLKEKRIIKPIGSLGQEKSWKLLNDNPQKVSFKVLPSWFIGKAEDMEWDIGDMMEHKYKSSGKIRIDFNIRGIDSNFGIKMRMMNKMLNEANVDMALLKSKNKELDTRFDEKVEKFTKTAKGLLVLPSKAPPKR